MLDKINLSQFSGAENYYRFNALFPNFVLTDGTRHVAKNGGDGGAYWLFEAIASHWPIVKKNPLCKDFQLWELKVDLTKKSAILSCKADSNTQPVIIQPIPYTDFDLDYIKFYVKPIPLGEELGNVIMLPSEY